MDDLISRRAAIDALAEQIMESALMDNPTTASTDIDSYRPIAELSLRDVPSAQPEHLVKESGNLVKGLVNDCISRQAAIDAVKQHMNNVSGGNDEYYIAHRHIIELLQIVPTAEPESRREWYMHGYRDAQRWIPVTEALPKEEDCPMDCLVTRKSKFIGNYTDMAVCEKNGTWTHEDWDAIVLGDVKDGKSTGLISTRDDNIIAWMPLPKPWKGEEHEL